MTPDWFPGSVRLTYRLGEITLFNWAPSGYTCARHFTQCPDREPVAPGGSGEPAGEGPFLFRSHPVAEALPQLSVNGEWIRYVPRQYRRFYVDLQGDFETYLNRFSSKSRSTLLRKVRKLAQMNGGEVDWKEYRSPEALLEFHRLAAELSRRTYQERLLDAGLPGSDAFKQHMLEQASRSLVRAYLLFIDGNPAAYVYCPLESGILFYEYVGFDPQHQNLSPGTVLQYLILKKLFEEGEYRIFDFTEGEGPQKAFFATHNVQCADVYLYRKTAWNLIAVRTHWAVDSLSRRFGDALDRLGLKTWVKRLLRRTA